MTKPRPDPYKVARYVAIGALEGMIAGWVLLGALILAVGLTINGMLQRER